MVDERFSALARAVKSVGNRGHDGTRACWFGASALCFLLSVSVFCAPVSARQQQHRPALRTGDIGRRVELRSRFASRVFDYSPGDGQFVNDPNFNDPVRALGAPIGGGTFDPDQSKLVTLGGHGGSITLGFDGTVRDDPNNPFGLDCIIFGNSFYLGGNPNVRFGEAAIIEISRDDNGNGIPDDAWYLIPGSDLFDPMNQRRNGFFVLPDDPYASPPLWNRNTDGTESYWGYGDVTPVLLRGDLDGDNVVDDPDLRAELFYTVPDDPFTVGITPGSGGGDAFDIGWAIDSVTNERVFPGGFDFIRITTGADGDAGQFGEVSTEIGGVASVASVIQ